MCSYVELKKKQQEEDIGGMIEIYCFQQYSDLSNSDVETADWKKG